MMTIFLASKALFLVELFLWMLGAFLIGYFFSWNFLRKKYQTEIASQNETIIELKNEMQSTIRARKTIDRGGIEIREPKKLNFSNIGIANETNKDDLTLINGIGGFIEKKLNSIGIYTYDQISKLSGEDIITVTDLIQFFPGRIVRDNWIGQAKRLIKNKS